MISRRTRTVIIGVVTSIWAVNFFAPFVVKEYNPSESINGIFMAVVGGLLALNGKRPPRTGGPRDDDKTEEEDRE